ncbi:DUF4238 domain-containing protein [Caulobacter sp.]|uniref:DUF4238 domain-containing protein n=1 Tax=Caulobacter sp. TaxID=78 RepID=UPI003BA89D22
MAPSNPPRRHHFMPVFYLKRWARADGCLEQFRRFAGRQIKPRRLAPTATGYSDDLYAMPGLSADLAQQVEKLFMQEVDSLAAAVLPALESGGAIAWTSETRTAWARFVRSLQLRTPADVAGVKQRAQDDWGVSIPLIQEGAVRLTVASRGRPILGRFRPWPSPMRRAPRRGSAEG